jgi:outer membrane protein OmpA-like peptidoglycan-associated protein
LNLKLSEDRVIAVRDYLISRGVPKARVKTKAFGGSMPLSRENTEEAHKLNRRVEARILEN